MSLKEDFIGQIIEMKYQPSSEDSIRYKKALEHDDE